VKSLILQLLSSASLCVHADIHGALVL